MGEWTLFSNHGHVLVCLANNHQARLRDVAAEVGITERAVQNILRELQNSGIVQISKHGRCNHYQINSRKYLRHPLESHCTIGKLLLLLKSEAADDSKSEVPIERPSKANKARSVRKPGQAESSAAMAPKAAQKEMTAPSEKSDAVGKAPPEISPGPTVPATPIDDEGKASKKASRDQKKSKPGADQQGSLF